VVGRPCIRRSAGGFGPVASAYAMPTYFARERRIAVVVMIETRGAPVQSTIASVPSVSALVARSTYSRAQPHSGRQRPGANFQAIQRVTTAQSAPNRDTGSRRPARTRTTGFRMIGDDDYACSAPPAAADRSQEVPSAR
jgi:hypothetical protein